MNSINIVDFFKLLETMESYKIDNIEPKNSNNIFAYFDDENKWFITFSISNEKELGDGIVEFHINQDNFINIDLISCEKNIKTFKVNTKDEFFCLELIF